MRPHPIVNPIQTATTDIYIDGLILRNGTPLMWQFDGGYISLDANGNPTSWNYYITDHLGSTRMVVTSTNTIKETINYYPYGSEMRLTDPALMANNTFKERFRFSGKARANESRGSLLAMPSAAETRRSQGAGLPERS